MNNVVSISSFIIGIKEGFKIEKNGEYLFSLESGKGWGGGFESRILVTLKKMYPWKNSKQRFDGSLPLRWTTKEGLSRTQNTNSSGNTEKLLKILTFRHFLLSRNALNTLQDLISVTVNLTSFTEISPEDDESHSEFGGSLPGC